MNSRKKLVLYYGGINKTYKHLEATEKRLKAMVEEEEITMTECVMRLNIMKQFKKALWKYCATKDYIQARAEYKNNLPK